MRHFFASLIVCLTACCAVFAQTEPVVIDLYPEGAPNSNGLTGEENRNENNRISNVTKPTLTVFLAEKPNGMAVIACPGGAYLYLAFDHEGTDMADWYNSQGITYAVLKYRMPNGHFECPLSDVREAMHIMHENADKWGVDHNKIGIQGASAGGHLASTLATHYRDLEERPAFQVLFYPAICLNEGDGRNLLKGLSEEDIILYSNDLQVTAGTPAAFILGSTNDGLCSDHCIRYYQALKAHGIPAALHMYPEGGHGWGFKDSFRYKPQWTNELSAWLQNIDAQLSAPTAVVRSKVVEDGGTGPHKAVVAQESTLLDYAVYRPENLSEAVKGEGGPLPLVVFANGGCHDSSARYEEMLSEIASHGYIIIALGELRMTKDLEGRHRTNPDQITFAIDWALQQTRDKSSPYYGMIAPGKIATAGQSCGGAQVLAQQAEDKRVMTHILYNSGMGDMCMAGADSTTLKTLHAPVLYMPGGERDIATPNAFKDLERIDTVFAVLANHATAGHIGAFDEPNGGSYARLSLAWLNYQLKGNKADGKIFTGKNNKQLPEFTITSNHHK